VKIAPIIIDVIIFSWIDASGDIPKEAKKESINIAEKYRASTSNIHNLQLKTNLDSVLDI
jgi:hypothetical protein